MFGGQMIPLFLLGNSGFSPINFSLFHPPPSVHMRVYIILRLRTTRVCKPGQHDNYTDSYSQTKSQNMIVGLWAVVRFVEPPSSNASHDTCCLCLVWCVRVLSCVSSESILCVLYLQKHFIIPLVVIQFYFNCTTHSTVNKQNVEIYFKR